MKSIKIIIICLVIVSCNKNSTKSEFNNIILDKNLNSKLFHGTDYIINPLTLKTNAGYDNVIDSIKYLVKSNIIVNNDSLRTMRFTNLRQIHADTLKLNIYETNPAYYQNLTILIVGKSSKLNTIIKHLVRL